jgi:PAS domain-containing protein
MAFPRPLQPRPPTVWLSLPTDDCSITWASRSKSLKIGRLQGSSTRRLVQSRDGWRQSLERGEPYELELRVRQAGGVHRWVQVGGLPLRDAQGRILYWCVLLTDIAERKRIQALLDGETRLLEMVASGRRLEEIPETMCVIVDSIVGNSASSILLIDRDGTFRYGAGPALPSGFSAVLSTRTFCPFRASCRHLRRPSQVRRPPASRQGLNGVRSAG